MHQKKPTPWSLDVISDVVPFLMASAVGVGNFLTIPELVLYQGGVKVLLLHLLGLALLGVPLVLAEIVWGRWLLRPFLDGARALDRRFLVVPVTAFFAVALIATSYTLELGRLVIYILRFITLQGISLPGVRFQSLSGPLAQYLAAVGVLLAAGTVAVRRPSRLVPWLKFLVFVPLGLWGVLSIWVLVEWGESGLQRLLYWETASFSSDLVLRVSSFSLFTLSAGMGLIYNVIFYGSQRARVQNPGEPAYWSKPGRPWRVLAWILVADLVSSLAALCLVSPFGLGSVGSESRPISGDQLLLDWLPQVFGPRSFGVPAGALLLGSMLIAGFGALATLLDFAVTNLQVEQKWSRRKSMAHVLAIGAVLMAPAVFPRIRPWFDGFGQQVLLPLSSMGLALVVGWRMPARAQQNILGRGLLLDSVFLIWRVSIRFVVPLVLILLVVREGIRYLQDL